MNPLFGIPSPASTTIKFPDSDLKKADFSSSAENQALKCSIIHDLILIRAISLAHVRKTMRRSVRNLSRLLTVLNPCCEYLAPLPGCLAESTLRICSKPWWVLTAILTFG